jgi:hypothetical protein
MLDLRNISDIFVKSASRKLNSICVVIRWGKGKT